MAEAHEFRQIALPAFERDRTVRSDRDLRLGARDRLDRGAELARDALAQPIDAGQPRRPRRDDLAEQIGAHVRAGGVAIGLGKIGGNGGHWITKLVK